MSGAHRATDREQNRYGDATDGADSLHNDPQPEMNSARDEAHAEMRAGTIKLVAIFTIVILVAILVIWPASTSTMVSRDLWGSGPIWLLLIGIALAPVVYYLYCWILEKERPKQAFLPDYFNVAVAIVVFLVVFIIIVATNTAAGAWMWTTNSYYLNVQSQNWNLADWHTAWAMVVIIGLGLAAIGAYLVLLWLIVKSSWKYVAIVAALVPVCLYLAIGSAMAHNANWI